MGVETILKVLVGSRAHGLADDDSDYDYRGVFAHPTREILGLGGHQLRATGWVEGSEAEGGGKADDTSWEVGHFLRLAVQCNPSILEVFAAPVIEETEWGRSLRALFPCVWHPQRVRDAFVGYGLNQRKKMLDGKDARPSKYAVSYLRVLCQAEWLLRVGNLLVDFHGHSEYDRLRRWRAGLFTHGEVVDACKAWQEAVDRELTACCRHDARTGQVNDWLVDFRLAHL